MRMEHTEAISTKAVERYLLGELNDTDAEAFEEHFFDCVLCADDVRDEAKLIDAGRALVRETKSNVVPITSRKSSRWGWLQVAAAALLVIGIGGPMMLLSAHSKPSAAAGQQEILTLERGAAANTFTLGKGNALILNVPVEPGDYRWSVVNAAGESVGSGAVSKENTRDGLTVVLLGELPAGSYRLVVDGVREAADGKPVLTQQFSIRQ
jgi:hypothetical protein